MEKKANSHPKTAKRFESLIVEAVDNALKELGGNASELVYLEIFRKHSISKQDIGRKFGEFILAVRQDFGSGGKTIEALILENLFRKMGPNSVEFQATTATIIMRSLTCSQNMEQSPCS